MIKNIFGFGCSIYAETIGEMWLDLVSAVLSLGEESFDEKRKRIALMNVRVKTMFQKADDKIIYTYIGKEKIKKMIDFTFSKKIIKDTDIIKSFKRGAKSYYQRIKEGRMLEFVIKRLSAIPESKKAVIVFPTYEDYAKIFEDQYVNDYLPCIVAVQFRLIPNKIGFLLNTTFYARSMDIYQKGHGNFVSIVILSEIVAREVGVKLNKKIKLGFLDGIIADAHIYGETISDAKQIIKRFKNDQKNLE